MKSAFVVGEALMDLIPVAGGDRVPMVGGGPANTAKAVARLGHATLFVGGISSDDYGRAVEKELLDSGVDLSLAYRGDLGTALAIATIDENGLAKYDFELEGTTSFAFSRDWLPEINVDVVHVGSVATLLEPGASELLMWLDRNSVPVVFDPNVRPSIEGNKAKYRAAVERFVAVADIVKLSDDDLNWLYGESDVIKEWLAAGVSLIVVTMGAAGLKAYGDGFVVEVPGAKIELVDSVGAGDSIGAVLVEGVLVHGFSEMLNVEILRKVLQRAVRAAGITCSRAGANPPRKEELDFTL
jgi:fructokinase